MYIFIYIYIYMKNYILYSKLRILRVKYLINTNIYNMKFSGCISNRKFSAHKNFFREKT